jgi:hypothetical protein
MSVPHDRPAPPEKPFWLVHSHLVGCMAMWAIAQAPIFPPRRLEAAIIEFHVVTAPDFPVIDTFGMKEFSGNMELYNYVTDKIAECPLIQEWNRSQYDVDNSIAPADQTQYVFVSRYDGPPAMHDFVDMGALARNIANHFRWENERNEDFEKRFNESLTDEQRENL